MITYSSAVKAARLQVVSDAVDAADPVPGTLVVGTTDLVGESGVLVSFTLSLPAFSIGDGEMELNGLPILGAVIASGTAALAEIRDGEGNVVAGGLTVGRAGSGAAIIMHATDLIAGGSAELLEAAIVHG